MSLSIFAQNETVYNYAVPAPNPHSSFGAYVVVFGFQFFCLAAMAVTVLADDNACSDSPVASAQEYLQTFDKFSLTYFDGRGL